MKGRRSRAGSRQAKSRLVGREMEQVVGSRSFDHPHRLISPLEFG